MSNNWETLEFIELADNNDALSWKPCDAGDYIIGEYIKTENGKGRGEGLLFHHLKDEDGQEVSILGSTVLNRKMEKVEPGKIVKIEYKGKAKNQNGRQYNNFVVYIAQSN